MSTSHTEWTTARARIGGLYRRGADDDDPRVQQARQELAAARLADQIELALADPIELARAAKIVRAAIARHRLTVELTEFDDGGGAAA